MKILANEKLSTHKYIDNSGYLICTDAILARTGKQEYLKSEIYENCNDNTIIEVDRKPEQVFSTETLASFENKPLTCEHPYENVTPDNYGRYAVGFIRNIRKGEHNGKPVMIGDIVVTNKQCIEDIQNNIRTDLSCGYDCDITEGDNPEQINIRGNHVALCEQGRAGIAKIIDTKTINNNVDDTNIKDEDRPEYAIWVKDLDNKWYIWSVTENNQLPENWLGELNRKNNTKYVDVKIVKNGEIVKDSIQDMNIPLNNYKKMPREDRKIINGILKNYNGYSTYDVDIMDIIDDLKNAGYEVINVSSEVEGQGYKNLHDKDYLLEVIKDNYRTYIQINFYRNNKNVTKEVNSYITDKLPRKIKKVKDASKYIIYKEGNNLMGTDLNNYNSSIKNARTIRNWTKSGFKSIEQIIEYLIEYGNINREDIIVKEDLILDEVISFVERYRGVQIIFEDGKFVGSYMNHNYKENSLDDIKSKIDIDKANQAKKIEKEMEIKKYPIYKNPKDIMKDSKKILDDIKLYEIWLNDEMYLETNNFNYAKNIYSRLLNNNPESKVEFIYNDNQNIEIDDIRINDDTDEDEYEKYEFAYNKKCSKTKNKMYDAISKINDNSKKYIIHYTGTYNDCVKFIDKKFETGTDKIWDIIVHDNYEYSKSFLKELNKQQNIARKKVEEDAEEYDIDSIDEDDDKNDIYMKKIHNKLKKNLKEQARLSKKKYQEYDEE